MKQNIHNLLTAVPFEDLWESQRLWPDPMEAPDVPPKTILTDFLEDSTRMEAELVRQIETSVACLRALEELIAEEPEKEISSYMTAFFQKAGIVEDREDDLNDVENTEDSPIPFPSSQCQLLSAHPGQIRSVRHELQCWDGESLSKRFNFKPVDILIVSNRIQRPAGDFFRAIPCSPSEIWRTEDMLCPEDVVFTTVGGSEWVLHTWLGYPVSVDDLEDWLGELNDAEMARIRGEIESLSSSDSFEITEPEWLSLERERLAERADTLPSTVDAQRLNWEAEAADESMNTRGHTQNILEYAECFSLSPRRAADDQANVSNLAVISQSEFDQFCLKSHSFGTVHEEPEKPQGEAIVLAGPVQDDEQGFLQWEIHPAQPKESKVLVVDIERKTELGEAHLSEDGRIVTLKDIPWEALVAYQQNRTRLSNLTILVIRP